MKTDTAPTIRLTDYTASSFLIDTVELRIRLDGANTRVHARYGVRPNPAVQLSGQSAILKLDADGQGALTVRVNGAMITPLREGASVSFDLSAQAPSVVEIETTLDPASNTALSGLYLTNDVYCTQCEAEGFRRIVPFLDRPDVLATYRVTLEARKSECPVLLSNGNRGVETDLSDGWHSIVWDDPHPKPSYLFALVGGALDKITDSFQTMDGRDIALAIYVEPGKTDWAGFAMEALKRSMAWDEVRFGRVYDLDVFNIVAVSDFNLGAMENKGLNIFNDKYILASPQTATDEDYERIEAIIAHEYFHNWSGNRVTCRDWFQLCLKEGLTVFRDQEYTSDTYDRAIKRIADVRTLWSHQFPEDGGPLAHPARPDSYREINNFYTATVYEKGAEIVRMIATWLGEARFRAAMDQYFASHDGQAATMEDFLAAMQAQSHDLGAWPNFLSWYTQAGTPHVRVDVVRGPGTLTLNFEQNTRPTPGQPEKIALPIPCKLGVVDENGADIDLHAVDIMASGGRWMNGQFLLEAKAGYLALTGLPDGLIQPSLFRDFSAPISPNITGLSGGDEVFLAVNDSNGFNSWSQFQALYSTSLQKRYHHLKLGETPPNEDALFDAMMAKVLHPNGSLDHAAIRAALVTLPSSHDLARTLAQDVDPKWIEDARTSFSQALCNAHGEAMLAALAAIGVDDDGAINPASAARRTLILALLGHLVAWDDARVNDLLARAYAQSIGMTMRIKTLALMIKRAMPQAGDALRAFEAGFGDDPLAMDKWFTVQASAMGEQALIRCQSLEKHPMYSTRNPNRVRALIGAFAMANITGFHASDGSGYAYVAARIGAIDRDNPQLAARLASAFRTWKTFSAPHRQGAKAALEELKLHDNLSRDTSDIVARILNG